VFAAVEHQLYKEEICKGKCGDRGTLVFYLNGGLTVLLDEVVRAKLVKDCRKRGETE
jgi:hypothetical protein